MGGRFCSVDQTHSECQSTLVGIMQFRTRNRLKLIGVAIIFDWRGAKSHAMTSSKIFKKGTFLWGKIL